MKLEIKDYCVRCGLCEDLYPQLFRLNLVTDEVDILYEDIPEDLEETVKNAIADCAVTAIFKLSNISKTVKKTSVLESGDRDVSPSRASGP